MKNRLEINRYGDKCWYLNDKLHRGDGPAIEDADGYKAWYLNGKCHRVDGPAIEWANGTKYWFLNGKLLDFKTQEEFEQYMKLKAFW